MLDEVAPKETGEWYCHIPSASVCVHAHRGLVRAGRAAMLDKRREAGSKIRGAAADKEDSMVCVCMYA